MHNIMIIKSYMQGILSHVISWNGSRWVCTSADVSVSPLREMIDPFNGNVYNTQPARPIGWHSENWWGGKHSSPEGVFVVSEEFSFWSFFSLRLWLHLFPLRSFKNEMELSLIKDKSLCYVPINNRITIMRLCPRRIVPSSVFHDLLLGG